MLNPLNRHTLPSIIMDQQQLGEKNKKQNTGFHLGTGDFPVFNSKSVPTIALCIYNPVK